VFFRSLLECEGLCRAGPTRLAGFLLRGGRLQGFSAPLFATPPEFLLEAGEHFAAGQQAKIAAMGLHDVLAQAI
jgi:hypothetical protein